MARILLIDDDVAVLEVMLEMVHLLGHEAYGADSGAAGLELIAARPPDLVIVDLAMPEISGAEVLGQVRQRHPDLPVVVLTAIMNPDLDAAMRNLGAAGFITKPVKMRQFRNEIEAALRGVA